MIPAYVLAFAFFASAFAAGSVHAATVSAAATASTASAAVAARVAEAAPAAAKYRKLAWRTAKTVCRCRCLVLQGLFLFSFQA